MSEAKLSPPPCSAFERRLREWLKSEWGINMERCGGPRAIGRCHGSWKTGWMVSGLPGFQYGWLRFSTLKAIADKSGFNKQNTPLSDAKRSE